MATGKQVEVKRTPEQLAVLTKFQDLIMAIPEAGGDGLGILEDILNATSADDLVGEQNGTTPIESLYDQDLRIDSVRRIESTITPTGDQLTDQYVVMEGVALADDMAFVTTTSAATILAVMAKMYSLHAFPIVVRFSASQTRSGFTALNCSVLAHSQGKTVDA